MTRCENCSTYFALLCLEPSARRWLASPGPRAPSPSSPHRLAAGEDPLARSIKNYILDKLLGRQGKANWSLLKGLRCVPVRSDVTLVEDVIFLLKQNETAKLNKTTRQRVGEVNPAIYCDSSSSFVFLKSLG